MRKAKIVSLILAFCAIGFCMVPSPHAEIYHSATEQRKVIALTFDDGPHPKLTEEILAVLAEYGIRATFFMIGENVEYYPEASKMVAEAGHEIGNHTYSHPHISGMNQTTLEDELKKTEEMIYSVTGVRTNLFRPPEGVVPSFVCRSADDLGYQIILWSVDTRDWECKNTGRIVNNVMSTVKPGDVILMHDYIGCGSKTPEALRILIPKLQRAGYEFVTVSELFGI